MDIVVPRKIGHPAHPEYAIGALTQTGDVFLDPDALAMSGLRPNDPIIKHIIEEEKAEAQRRLRHYRGSRPPLDVKGWTCILVDDGIATGSTMKAAIKSVKAGGAEEIVVAAPVGAPDSVDELRKMADKVVVLLTPPQFHAVGLWYQNFGQTSDQEVIEIMKQYEEGSFYQQKKQGQEQQQQQPPPGSTSAALQGFDDEACAAAAPPSSQQQPPRAQQQRRSSGSSY